MNSIIRVTHIYKNIIIGQCVMKSKLNWLTSVHQYTLDYTLLNNNQGII